MTTSTMVTTKVRPETIELTGVIQVDISWALLEATT